MSEKIGIIGYNFKTIEGWGTVAYNLSEELNKYGEIVKFDMNSNQSDYFRFNTYNLFNSYYFFKENKDKFKDLDILICTAEIYLGILYFVKKYYNDIRIIFLGHGTFTYTPFVKNPIIKYLNRYYLRSIDNYFIPSQYSLNKIREYSNREIKLIRWGVNIEMYENKNVEKERAFIFVGAQKERKGVDLLLEAFEKLTKEFPDIKLYFVGSKNPKYMKISYEKGLKDKAIFLGRVEHDELVDLYNKSLCQVLPSRNYKYNYEGFGLVHLEANACGTPSIGSSDSANDDVIEDGVSGYLVKQGDVNDLYEKMKKILNMSKKEYSKLCKSSYEHVKKYSWEKTCEILLKK